MPGGLILRRLRDLLLSNRNVPQDILAPGARLLSPESGTQLFCQLIKARGTPWREQQQCLNPGLHVKEHGNSLLLARNEQVSLSHFPGECWSTSLTSAVAHSLSFP